MPFVPIPESGSGSFVPLEQSPEDLTNAFMSGELVDPTPAEALRIRKHQDESRFSPSALIKGAVPAVKGLVDMGTGAIGEQARMAGQGITAPVRNTLAAGEGALRSGQQLGEMGRDAVDSRLLHPYQILQKAVQARGVGPTAAELGKNALGLLNPFTTHSTSTQLGEIFPAEGGQVAQEALKAKRSRTQDAQRLSEGKDSLLGDVVTDVADRVGASPETAGRLGEAANPGEGMKNTVEVASNLIDPTAVAGFGIGKAKQLLGVGGRTLTASELKATAGAVARWEESAAAKRAAAVPEKGVPPPLPGTVPPAQPSALPEASAAFSRAALEEGAQSPGLAQKAVGKAGEAAGATGETVQKLAIGLDEVAARYEMPLVALATVAGMIKGPAGAFVGSMVPRAIRRATQFAKGASSWGSALRSVAAADWDSALPVWRQVAHDPNAPGWVVRAVKMAPRTIAAAEEGARTGARLAEGAAHGAATGLVMAASDAEKGGEELGGAVGSGAVLGSAGAAVGLAGAKEGRRLAGMAHDAMTVARRSILEGNNPVAVAMTPDVTMSNVAVLQMLGRGTQPGGRDLKIDLMDAAHFAQVAPKDANSVAFHDAATGRAVVNIESNDPEGRMLHEAVGHALMESSVSRSPEILEHFERTLGPEGLQKAREDYARAMGVPVGSLPPAPAWIISELFAESAAAALRSANLSDELPGILGRTPTRTFFSDPRVVAAITDPASQTLVRRQFQALQDFSPAIDGRKEATTKVTAADVGVHPGLPAETDFATKTPDGRVVASPPQVVQQRVRSRRKEINVLFPDDPAGAATPAGSDIHTHVTPSGESQRSGTKLGQRFYETAQTFNNSQKQMLRLVEDSISAGGKVLSGWYQEVGQSAMGWQASVREKLGNIEVGLKEFIPTGFKITKVGNLLIENYSVTALERKAAAWAQRDGPLSLSIWGGDIAAFRNDVKAYMANHAEGRPGDAGIGAAKRDLINVFMVGGNRTYEALNPLRPLAKGEDRQGIIRSYRADRMQTVQPSDIAGFAQPAHGKQVRNMSPEVPKQTDSPEFKSWFGQSKAVDAQGKPLRVFHGSSRADRVGSKLDPKRATSGPMPFFTTDPKIASNYAEGKADTSIDMPESYSKWFTRKVGGKALTLDRVWWRLKPEERAELTKTLPRVSNIDANGDEMPSGQYRLLPEGEYGLRDKASWDYSLRENGNPLMAAVDGWLESGTLFGQEDEFLKVLETAGMKDVSLDDPNAKSSGIVPAFLSIQKPLDTSAIPADVISALETAGRRSRARVKPGNDQWAKTGVSPGGWLDRLRGDRENNTTHAWTSIPDWVTDTLKTLGYDGIHDTGGKFQNVDPHRVWVPFDQSQVKSAIGNRGTFDPTKPDLRHSPEVAPLPEGSLGDTLPPNETETNIGGGVPDSRFRVDPAIRGGEYAAAIRRTKAEHPFGFAVDDKGDEFYTAPDSQLFLSQDGLAGVAVTNYGDLVSVFKHPSSQADVKPLLADAAKVSQTLDAFDVKGFLPNLYAKFGFRPVARVAFNKEYAPPGWRYDLAGEPDVVMMVKDVTGATGAPDMAGKDYNAIRETVPLFADYNEASDAQTAAKAKVAAALGTTRFSPEVDLERPSGEIMRTSAVHVLHGTSQELPPPESGKRRNDAVAADIQAAAIEQWGRPINSTDWKIDREGLVIPPKEEAVIVDNATREVVAALQASGRNAFDWYTHDIRSAVAIMGVIHPELVDDARAQATGHFPNAPAARLGMMMAMAITSQNLTVSLNSRFAEEQFASLRTTGKFDPARDYGEKAESISSNLTLANTLIESKGWDGAEAFLRRDFTVADLSAAISKITGKKRSIAGRRGDIVQGAAIFGPKIGQGFLQNLFGNYNPVTIDLWMRRTWGRWTGDVLGAGVTPERLARLLDASRERGEELPENLRLLRAVTRRAGTEKKPGAEYRTMSDRAETLLETDQAVHDSVVDFSSNLASKWQAMYRSVRQFGLLPADAQALREGRAKLDDIADRHAAVLERLQVQYKRLKGPKGGKKPALAEWRKAQMEKLGYTEFLTNDELSEAKPEWAKAAIVIKNQLKPIDIPSDQDRMVISRVVNQVRERLKAEGHATSNADIQALLWYPEKDLWAKLRGENESNLKQSYPDEFLKIAQARGLGAEAHQARSRLDAQRAAGTPPNSTGANAGADEGLSR